MNINHNHLFAALAALVFTVSACKKDPDPVETPTAAKTCFMNKYIYRDTSNRTNPVQTTTYEYDANYRVVKETDGSSITTISYNGNTISAVKVPNIGTTTTNTTLTTNSAGFVTKKIQETNSTRDTTTYEYDSNGYLSKETDKYGRYNYSIANGNVTTIVYTSPSGGQNWTMQVEMSDKLYKAKIFSPWQNTGKLDKHIWKKITLNFSDNTQLTVDRSSIIVNSEGYLTQLVQTQTQKDLSSVPATVTYNNTTTNEYSYLCK